MALTPGDFTFLSNYVKNSTAIVLTPDKDYLVESRLNPVARRLGVSNISDLVSKLRANPSPTSEIGMMISEAMTTNETYFFRDVKPFDVLRSELLPQAIERRGSDRSLNIWSGACSSGQEAYSIAMTIKEHFPTLSTWRVRIIGTDISRAMVERTKEGIFSQIEINRGLPAPLLVKYFSKVGSEWKIKGELTSMVDASVMNLAGNWPILPRMDIVLMRNVLIYFDLPTKRAILEKVVRVMAPNASLLLGGSETTMNVTNEFDRVTTGTSFYYRIKGGGASSSSPSIGSTPTFRGTPVAPRAGLR
ncbi:CheR family methyltransferase [Acidithrix ferrooxidans]|uniref:protein-glutamate O-methyltransferase n=1 Tax=Acidithrix ferrooxidans TaxID=1280514 RepID=A0A0D8HJ52_9ACTN|nr:protein-glutamate O-methyltransferase CheR [Acidithrix ferrooxidans]KJF17948.1 chemotaxis protein methyltransferase cher2 [Acidithrix ferrooxidans]